MNHSEVHDAQQVYHCYFELNLMEATMTIKFPCTFFVELKSSNGKIIYAMTSKRVPAVDSVATFNEVLNF